MATAVAIGFGASTLITRAAEQLVDVSVEPAQQAVTIRYRPRRRGTLFAIGLGTELAVAVAIGVLAVTLGARRNDEQRTASGERHPSANQRVLDPHRVVTEAIDERRDIE